MSDISFDVGEILEESRKAAGLEDFGPGDIRPGLEALAATYETGGFNERGRKRNRRRLVQLLVTRLKMQAVFDANPEILERPIRKPMVLTGMPRSGTSALFNLLARDPSARPLLLWETQFPDPLEGLEPGQPDPRRDALEAHYAKSREENPEFTKIHYAAADNPEECVLIHAYSFHGVQMGVEIMLEPYASWYRRQDLGEMYTYYRRTLQLLDWQRPGERWLLKAPAHMWGIDPLIETFPDVSILWSHRDPLQCTASICSMTWTMLATTAPAIIGSIWRRTCAPTPLVAEACRSTACISCADPNIWPRASNPWAGAGLAASRPNIRAKPAGSRPTLRWRPSVRAGISASKARAVCSVVRPNGWPMA